MQAWIELLGSFLRIFSQYPFLTALIILLLIITPIVKSPAYKGWIGERQMRRQFERFLPEDIYRVINNVTIPDGQSGTTQIDHVIISPYGVFVVETKHYSGWIFGGEYDRQWTQKIHGNHSQKFQNPLRQNYKHTECLRTLLGLTKDQVKSVVVFIGNSTLKTQEKLPAYVTKPESCVRYILSFQDLLFKPRSVDALEAAISENRLTPGWKTAREHTAYVKTLHPTQQKPVMVANKAAEVTEIPVITEPIIENIPVENEVPLMESMIESSEQSADPVAE